MPRHIELACRNDSDLARFFIPTDVRWAEWRQVGQFLAIPNQKVLIATYQSSLVKAEELKKIWWLTIK